MEPRKPKKLRVIVAGSRTLTNYLSFREKLIRYLNTLDSSDIEIITGMASNGPDDMAYHLARWDLKLLWKEMPADWDQYGKSAGYIRNTEMVSVATHLFAMWDGKSKGTRHMIDIAKLKGIPVKLHVCDPDPIQRVFII